jgi:hypothetical protein
MPIPSMLSVSRMEREKTLVRVTHCFITACKHSNLPTPTNAVITLQVEMTNRK